MASSLCKLTVYKVYQDVIEDVINSVRELFLEDGVDEQVLQELRQIWETKLLATKAVDNQTDVDSKLAVRKADISNGTSNGFAKLQQSQTALKQVVGQVPPNNHVQTPVATQVVETKLVPIQITLPAQPGTDGSVRVLTIQVPTSALQGNQLQKILTGPVISATMSLPHNLASAMLQQHVNASIGNQQPQQIQVVQQGQPQTVVQQLQPTTQNLVGVTNNIKSVIQNDGAADSNTDSNDEVEQVAGASGVLKASWSLPISNTHKNKKTKRTHKPSRFLASLLKIEQLDGIEDTSDDDEDGSDDDEGSDDADDDRDEDEQEMDEGGPEEEPLNSEDDVTDEDAVEVFDTENVIVCQYDKITRSRNKWKFHLKDGIMNLDGEDYVFQKANGDAEW